MNTTQVIVAIFSGGGILGAFVAMFRFRPELDRQSVATATELLESMRADLAASRAENAQLRERVARLEARVAELLRRAPAT